MPLVLVSPDRVLMSLRADNFLLVVERWGLAVALRRFLADGSTLSWRFCVGRLSRLARLLVLVWCAGA